MKTLKTLFTLSNHNRFAKQLLSKPLILFLSIFILTSCETDDTINDLQTNGPVFDINLFEQNIINYVNSGGNTPVGWSYTISKNGNLARSNSYGQARTAVDGVLDFTLDKEINVASVTKFYTAIAVMQLLETNNLTIDDKISEWLPSSWPQGPGVSDLTFKDLLTHRSGLESSNNNFNTTLGYQGLAVCIRTGVINSKNYNYLNVNFALYRVLIPSLWSALPNAPTIDINSDTDTRSKYIQYMQQNIFDRISLPDVGCSPEPEDIVTLYYNVNDINTNANGLVYSDWNNKAGGGGYYMTTIEMAKVIAFFEHSEILVNQNQRAIMKLHRIGMDRADLADEIHGNYYGKGGSIGTNSNQTLSKGVLTQMVMFPINGIDCVVVMNCRGVTLNNNTNLRQMIYDAYNNAWQ
ncbi:hypothetical protein AWE51_12620 [Aquimarina aggregata]|uniref:Beta-lactamase-related domain-containing protein n=1 Tax=Aquimarina aggregata TaxID=1642818 RepID=A0A162YVE4_9FLAO|nr:serine hydrolase [Aquimarina aggregata]KZS39379.1 hypothetical protein AWE51_12620 [Aquimarina aggregata]